MLRIIFPFLLFIFAGKAIAQDDEAKLVQEAFNKYKTAILNDQGKDAVEWIDSRTEKYYGEILEKVKHADSLTVESFSLLDKLMVFTIRHRASKEEILSFDGKSLMVYAIEKGMVGKNSVMNLTIGEVNTGGNFAKGQIVVNGKPEPYYFHFYKENGVWKIDLTSAFAISATLFEQMAEASGETENDYLFMLLEMITGDRPGHKVWEVVESNTD